MTGPMPTIERAHRPTRWLSDQAESARSIADSTVRCCDPNQSMTAFGSSDLSSAANWLFAALR